ncbi:MAG: HD-GYP domain-containing protein [Candidatus Eremiobacteraeota bacterium]|nr:HD-GYP domain-containing protein [Candidatus Eremiobacteraeota bacterium]
MHDDDQPHDAPHTSRAHVADLLSERRIAVAGDVVARLRRRDVADVSPLIVRSLVDALVSSLAEGSPDNVVHWSRMVRHAHSAPVVAAAIETICEVVEELAHAEHGDLASILVFLEVVKTRTRSRQRDLAPATDAGDDSSLAAIESLLAMLSVRDEATCIHSRATGEWGRRIATRMGIEPPVTERIVKAGILHDIGKIRIPDEILFKPSSLTDGEWEIMKRHAEAGAEILSEIPALAPFAPVVATHHERFDGRGYPHGLRGDDISLESRVVSVADSFHAMTTDRPYRRALSYGEAIAALVDGRGRQWDKEVTDVMIALAAADRNSSADANLSALSGSILGLGLRLPGDVRAI